MKIGGFLVVGDMSVSHKPAPDMVTTKNCVCMANPNSRNKQLLNDILLKEG